MADSLLKSESRDLTLVRLVPQVASAFGVLVACAVLIGWALDIGRLRSVLPNQPQMVPNTALCFILASVSLWLLRTDETRSRWNRAGLLFAGAVVLFSLATLAEYALGLELGIDRLLFGGRLQSGSPSLQGRPSPHTAANFFLLGSSLLLLVARRTRLRSLSQYLAIAATLGAVLAMVGYAYRVAFLYSISPSTGMALHTALTFLVLGLGCLSAQPNHGLMLLVLSDTGGGIMARRLLPAACLLPIIFGGLIVAGQRIGFYEMAFGMALFVTTSILAVSILIWVNAKTLYRVDNGRQRAERELRNAKDDLEARVEQRTAELSRVNSALQAEMAERKQSESARLQLLRQLVTTQEEERRRISRELHDQMGQQLSSLMLGLKAMERMPAGQPSNMKSLQQLESLTEHLVQKVHHLAQELRPAALDDLGLQTALINYLEKWSERSGVPVDFHDGSLDKQRLPSQVETTVYRVIQEALTNVLKHARAHRVSVILNHHRDQMLAIVEDDGKGFDAEILNNATDNHRGLGILGMQERVALVGGILNIESVQDGGTTLVVRIPVANARGASP